MLRINSAAIKKKKKGEVEMEESLGGSSVLKTITSKPGGVPTTITAKTGGLPQIKSAEIKPNPVLSAKSPAANKHPEAKMELELMLKGAKKKKEEPKEEENSYTDDLGYFNTKKDSEGKWKESGESRANYLRKLKSMKK
jgi:hypothetical protein